MNAKKITQSPNARKVVGSLGILGAAAAVAGMGTFGTFTDSTTPIAATIASGTIDIDVTGPGVTVPVTTSNFVPGDSVTQTVNLMNKGTAALGSVSLSTTAAAPSVLTTDLTKGLQLAVKSCSVAWTGSTCGAGEQLLGSGPAVSNLNLANAASLNAGGTDYLAFTISLPVGADNTFQGKSATLSLTFTGSQRTGTAR